MASLHQEGLINSVTELILEEVKKGEITPEMLVCALIDFVQKRNKEPESYVEFVAVKAMSRAINKVMLNNLKRTGND